jgi:hypothetical protein
VSFGGLLGHQGDSGSTGLDGQAGLDGALGRVQVVQRVPVPDGQVGNDVAELAVERGECRVSAEDALGQGAEGRSSRAA